MTADTPADRAVDHAATIRANTLHTLKGSWTEPFTNDTEHTPDCAGCIVDAALTEMVAELADLRKYNERVKQQRDSFFSGKRRLQADASRLADWWWVT